MHVKIHQQRNLSIGSFFTTKLRLHIKSSEEKNINLIGWKGSFAIAANVENGDTRPIKEGDAVLRSTESEKKQHNAISCTETPK